jgi:uncharacterized protein (DUF427 family)
MSIMQSLRRLMSAGPPEGTRVRAVWDGKVLAESDRTVMIEGNHYFPPDSVDRDVLVASDRRSVCPWKGTASYYDVVVDGARNPAAAWHYPSPKPAAAEIKDRVAFWKGVRVEAAA